MNKRVQKYREKLYSHSYTYEKFDPPLKVICAVLSRWGPGDSFSNKRKKVMSLNLVTMGSGTFEQNGVRGSVVPGEIFLAHRGADQTFKTGDAGFLHKRSLLIEGSVLESLLRTTGLALRDVIKPSDPVLMVSLFRQACRTMRDKPPRFTIILSTIIHEILLELARSIATTYPAPIQAAIEHMKRNLDRVLSLEQLTAVSGLSGRHFSRLFTLNVGVSPAAFFVSQKMDLAENLLLNTTLSVKQVAAALGYEDQFHFSIAFKKHSKQSPLYFREQRF